MMDHICSHPGMYVTHGLQIKCASYKLPAFIQAHLIKIREDMLPLGLKSTIPFKGEIFL